MEMPMILEPEAVSRLIRELQALYDELRAAYDAAYEAERSRRKRQRISGQCWGPPGMNPNDHGFIYSALRELRGGDFYEGIRTLRCMEGWSRAWSRVRPILESAAIALPIFEVSDDFPE